MPPAAAATASDSQLCVAQLRLEETDALARQICSLTYVNVFGHTHSGTTLTEALLSLHEQVASCTRMANYGSINGLKAAISCETSNQLRNVPIARPLDASCGKGVDLLYVPPQDVASLAPLVREPLHAYWRDEYWTAHPHAAEPPTHMLGKIAIPPTNGCHGCCEKDAPWTTAMLNASLVLDRVYPYVSRALFVVRHPFYPALKKTAAAWLESDSNANQSARQRPDQRVAELLKREEAWGVAPRPAQEPATRKASLLGRVAISPWVVAVARRVFCALLHQPAAVGGAAHTQCLVGENARDRPRPCARGHTCVGMSS